MTRAGNRKLVLWLCLAALGASCRAKPSTVPLGGEEPAPEVAHVAEKPETEEPAESEEETTTAEESEPTAEGGTESKTAASEAAPSEECRDEGTTATPECADDKAELGDCSTLRRPVELCAAAVPLTEYCNVANHLLRPGVARAYYDCVARHSGTEALCAPKLQQDCFVDAAKVSCSHASFDKECAMLAHDCPDIPRFFRQNCQAALRAIRDDKREEFSRCLARCDLAACVALEPGRR